MDKIKWNTLLTAFCLLSLFIFESCVPSSGLNSLTNIESECAVDSDAQTDARFARLGFVFDQYITQDIKNNPQVRKTVKDAFAALSDQSIQTILRIDQSLQNFPVDIREDNGVQIDSADNFMVGVGPLHTSTNQPSAGTVTMAVTVFAKVVGASFGRPYRITIANDATVISPKHTVEVNAVAVLHELGHVITDFWQYENQQSLFADKPGTFQQFEQRFNADTEFRKVVTAHTATSEAELMANTFHAMTCSPDSYISGMRLIPDVMNIFKKYLPVPKWRNKAVHNAMPGIRVNGNTEELWIAMSADSQKLKICEGGEAACLSGSEKMHTLTRPQTGKAWGVKVATLPSEVATGVPNGGASSAAAQKVFTIFAQDDRGHDYFYTFKLER